MNRPRVIDEDYIQFLIGTSKVCSATEAERLQPARGQSAAHDASTRLRRRLEPKVQALWQSKFAPPALNVITSNWLCALSYIWSVIITKPASVGLRLNSLSFGLPSATIWLIYLKNYPQLRNS
jgi:hypothetical protein